MGIVSFDSHCYADVSLRLIALPLKTRHFQTQLGLVLFKLKWPKVPVDQFSKLKRGLFQKRASFHLPCGKVGKANKIV